jgi:hypothetical protein
MVNPTLYNFNLGPKPQKSFSVTSLGQAHQEVQKEFDLDLKQNVFVLAPGQRIQLPPNPAQSSAYFHHKGPATK